MEFDITPKQIEDYLSSRQETSFEYTFSQGATLSVYRKLQKNGKWTYSCVLEYKNHTVWASGGYDSAFYLVKDLASAGYSAFQHHIS